MNRFITVGLIVFMIITVGCTNYVDPVTEISAVKVVLDRFYIALQKEDMTALSALLAHDDDIVVFGLIEREGYVGWENVKGMYQRQMDIYEGIQTTLADQVIKISKDGTFSWVSSLNHARGQSGENTFDMNYRSTMILEKRDGKWLLVQQHFSLASDAEDN